MDEKPFLNDLSQDHLDDLSNTLMRLADAGRSIAEGGFTPRFSLVPGLRPTIWIDYAMPEIWRPASEADLADFAALQQGSSVGPDLSAMLAAERELYAEADDLSEFPAPAPQEAEPGIGGEGLAVALPADPLPADPLPAAAFVDNTPDQPAPTSQPGSASAMAAARPAPWSEEEDAKTISIYLNALEPDPCASR